MALRSCTTSGTDLRRLAKAIDSMRTGLGGDDIRMMVLNTPNHSSHAMETKGRIHAEWETIGGYSKATFTHAGTRYHMDLSGPSMRTDTRTSGSWDDDVRRARQETCALLRIAARTIRAASDPRRAIPEKDSRPVLTRSARRLNAIMTGLKAHDPEIGDAILLWAPGTDGRIDAHRLGRHPDGHPEWVDAVLPDAAKGWWSDMPALMMIHVEAPALRRPYDDPAAYDRDVWSINMRRVAMEGSDGEPDAVETMRLLSELPS
jgi:hypothetical protein